MSEIRIPVDEQETVIRWYRTDTEATVSTSDSTVITAMEKLVEKGSARYGEIQNEGYREYILSKKAVHLYAPRLQTEENKKRLAEMARRNFGK